MNQDFSHFEGVPIETPKKPDNIIYHATIRKEVTSWGRGLAMLGVFHFIGSGFLDAGWGITLLLVAAASFYYRSASMLILYAVTVFFAGFTNIFSGNWLWIIFSLIQFYLAVTLFIKFFKYKRSEADTTLDQPEAVGLTPERSARAFPWWAFGFGLTSNIMVIGLLIIIVAFSITNPDKSVPDWIFFIEGLLVNLAVLGWATGLAGLLSKYEKKGLSITGIVCSSLVLLLEISLALLG